ncbi:hypothetical protein TDMWS_18850 [Thermodesulfomicrobium sp. WS]|nr:hypothetical protein TDMWS_18850 [Thermodesulfomicrobium sp. WS]
MEPIPTPRGTFTIRPATDADTPGILALWQAAFGRPLEPRLWAWKYRGPLGAHITLAVAPNGAVAAAFPTVPVPARVDGAPAQVELAMDSASHPAFREVLSGRTGLFVRTARAHMDAARQRGTRCLYGFPGPRHLRLGELLLGYVPCTAQPVFLTGRPTAPPAPGITLTPMPPDADLSWVDPLDARYGPATALRRTAAFLTWRFRSHPQHPYQLWALHQEPRLRRLLRRLSPRAFAPTAPLGYLCTLPRPGATRVVDLLLPPALLPSALALLARSTALPLELWLAAAHPLRPPAEAAGLTPDPEPLGATAALRPLTQEAPPLAMAYTLADTDVDHLGG